MHCLVLASPTRALGTLTPSRSWYSNAIDPVWMKDLVDMSKWRWTRCSRLLRKMTSSVESWTRISRSRVRHYINWATTRTWWWLSFSVKNLLTAYTGHHWSQLTTTPMTSIFTCYSGCININVIARWSIPTVYIEHSVEVILCKQRLPRDFLTITSLFTMWIVHSGTRHTRSDKKIHW